MWFRINGYGLSIAFSKPLFSEREGLKKPLIRIGLFNVEFLKPPLINFAKKEGAYKMFDESDEDYKKRLTEMLKD
jgi:hypothetical protein